MDKALKSFNSNKMNIYLNRTKKKQSFTSPAIKVIKDIVSKNKLIKINNTRQFSLLKHNKNLDNYVQQIGSLVITAANQKSYHKGYFSTKKIWKEEADRSLSDELKHIGKGFLSSFYGFNSWAADKYNATKNGTTSWISNNYKWSKNKIWSNLQGAGAWTVDKYNAAKNGTTSWISNNYKWSKNKIWSNLQGAGAWTVDKYNAVKNGTTSWISNNYKWSKNKIWSNLQGAGAWATDKYDLAINGGKNIISDSKSWIGTKSRDIQDWYFNSKEEIQNFFDISDWINKGKESGQKVLESLKNFGYGLSYKMQDMWDHPWTKRVRKVGNGVFKSLDIIGSVNKVVQASTPEEKMIEVSKIVGAKIGSIALGAGLGALGGLIPGAQPAIPVFVGTGAFLGDKGGEKLGEWGGKALTNIWPKNWWPLKTSSKTKETSSIRPTKNIGIDKNKKNTILSSSSKKTKQIHVNLPHGAIQISNNNNHKLDYSGLVDQISTHFVKEFRRAMENRKTIMA
jgi:hypothetical protein